MNYYSPILLFCYRKLDTLKECIESLKNCPEAKFTDIYIFSDAAVNPKVEIEVTRVRDYLQNVTGFKSINLRFRNHNLGVDYNIINGIEEMSKVVDQFIVIEDDLSVSVDYLRFLNEALIIYKDFDKVLTVSAFNYVKIPKNYIWDCYFAGRTNPWGWATWSHKIKLVDWELANRHQFQSQSKLKKQFNLWGSDRSLMLKHTLLGKIRAWDIRLDYYQFSNGMFTAYSTKNLVINNGFGRKDASNTLGYNRFKVSLNSFGLFAIKFPEFLFVDSIIKRRFIERNNLINRILTRLFKLFKIT
jgi:hypothetical protein